ncbi:hypothetical protein [Hymenobacter sp.]|uniref:hypothetical protein n=1 Tax=Hymenobacter sp. TaxID=1898978 RepID=UPI00286AC0E1|nr:hypothetical protein [Hymenobacter sp.]
MNSTPRFFAALLLALPLAAAAQTTPAARPAAPNPRQVTEVTEDLDPATGKVVRRTTRTYVPADTPATAGSPAPARTVPARTVPAPAAVADGRATDAQVTAFLRRKTAVATLSAPALLNVYAAFLERVNADRHGWRAADWATAANVLSALNARYEQLRTSFSFEDKLTIRSQQAEFQTLRTARQLSDQVSDKL